MEKELFQLVEKGTSAVMVVQEAARQLQEAGFEELSFERGWGLSENGRYFVRHHDTTLFAFAIGAHALATGTILIRKSWSKLRAEMTFVREPISIPTKSVDR